MRVEEGWELPMKVECIVSGVSGLESGPHNLCTHALDSAMRCPSGK